MTRDGLVDERHGRGRDAAPGPPAYFGIKLVALHRKPIFPPAWLTMYDPDGGDETIDYPTGEIESSTNRSEAMRFESFAAASACWRQQSKRTPLRPDGLPNRPLSAFTVEIERLP
jgi:hypothetical protein